MGLALVLSAAVAAPSSAQPVDGSNSAYVQAIHMKDEPPVLDGEFARGLAMDGDTLVIGVENATVGSPLAARVRVRVRARRNGTSWSRQATLRASNAGDVDGFGIAVAIDGETIVAGAPLEDGGATGVDGADDDAATDAGAACVFVRNGTAWSQQAYRKASDTGPSDTFGSTVAVSGATVVVGSPREDGSSTGVNGTDDDAAQWAGAAYVWPRTSRSCRTA